MAAGLVPEPTVTPPAIAVQNSRDISITNDFLRFLYIPPDKPPPASLGLEPKKRLFFQASQFLVPPLTVGQDITFPGLTDIPDQTLYALRCQPSRDSGADPILASWLNVFGAIVEDFGGAGFNCPAPLEAPGENTAYCDALAFSDKPQQYADEALINALTVGMQLFAIMVPGPAPSNRLRSFMTLYYGAYSSFTGLGYAVSGSGDNHPLSAADVTRNMIVPEYLLKNTTLSGANCHCIGIPPTVDPNARLSALLDVDVIWDEGDTTCPAVTLQ